MSIVLAIDPAGFKAMQEKLGRIQAAIPMAIAQGLNEGGDRVRTQVKRALKQQTSLLRDESINSRMSTERAFAGGGPASAGMGAGSASAYVIHVKGKPSTRIEEFRYRVKTGPGGYVAAKMWGVDHVFQRSFQKAGTDGPTGLRARTSSARFPIRSFDGPNLAKETMKGIVPSVFVLATAEFVTPIIIKRLGRVLG